MKFFTKKFDDVTTLDDSDLICYCCEVDKRTIVKAIKEGTTTLQEIKTATNACTGNECAQKNPNRRCCSKEINQLIKLHGNN